MTIQGLSSMSKGNPPFPEKGKMGFPTKWINNDETETLRWSQLDLFQGLFYLDKWSGKNLEITGIAAVWRVGETERMKWDLNLLLNSFIAQIRRSEWERKGKWVCLFEEKRGKKGVPWYKTKSLQPLIYEGCKLYTF